MVSSMFRRLVERLLEKLSWLKSADNLALYNDTRSLMNYVKNAHGGVFRRVVLSALLDPAHKSRQQKQLLQQKQQESTMR